MQSTSTSLHYDRRTILFHWLTVGLVASLWSLGQSIDWFPKGTPRVFARSTHIALGVCLVFVLAGRIWWRLSAGTHLLPAGVGSLDKVATATHRLLYGLLATVVALGVTNAGVRADSIFNLFKLPALVQADDTLRETIGNWHGFAANALLMLAFSMPALPCCTTSTGKMASCAECFPKVKKTDEGKPQDRKIKHIGWLRPWVLGANDGIVSTASLGIGVSASHAAHGCVLLPAIAGLVSGSMAKATGECVSVSLQADTESAR